MKTKKHSTVVGVFHDAGKAQEAVRALKKAGFTDDQIGVLTPHEEEHAKGSRGKHVAEGAAVGVAAGAGVGALWALGIAASILPGIGPVVAGGIFASILASAAGGAAIAGIVGALVGLGIPEEDAHYYEGEFKAGNTLVTVKAEGRYDEAWSILHGLGGYNRQSPAVTTDATGGKTVKVHEEQLHARKTPVKTGEVRVHKEVVTEQQTLQVPVTREEVVIERRPAHGRASASDIKDGEEIRIPVSEERVDVEKETVATEEVSVGKRKVHGTEHVGGTVRKERVKVEKEGAADVRGDTIKKKGK